MRSNLSDRESAAVHTCGLKLASPKLSAISPTALVAGVVSRGRSAFIALRRQVIPRPVGRQITTVRGKVDDIRIPETQESDCGPGLVPWPGCTKNWGG